MLSADSQSFVSSLPTASGVYRMLNEKGEVLYVGKARNLRKRVGSYFGARGLASTKIAVMMQQVADIAITVTHTEDEALLLENNLIKSLRPRYNIVLRDDKSYPYIYLSAHRFPRLGFHRGARKAGGRYFGPYPSASAVRETLNLLQKLFPVRQCEDSFYRHRTRPCLQYQIKRCTAPCVGLVDEERYQEDVRHAEMFLEGRTQAVVDELVTRMEQAAERLDYETAGRYRDRIAALKRVQERQYISGEGGDADVLAAVVKKGRACVAVSFIRGGRNLGTKNFFPTTGADAGTSEVLTAFLPQYYLGKSVPADIYLNQRAADKPLLERTFGEQTGRKVTLHTGARGARRRWLQMTQTNAEDALRRLLISQSNLAQRFEALQQALALDAVPERMECFDISHTFGEATIAACVVFDRDGPVKSDYRRFNIRDIQPGDDYGALTQALMRRFRRLKDGEGKLPDLLLVDGGKGQLSCAEQVLAELQIGGVPLIGVAKGRGRKPGKEQLFLSGHARPTILSPDSPALHLIQQVRDEAHRFAITGHRQRRAKTRTTSALEQIAGIGDKRRQALLKNLGGMQEVARAGVEDLARVPGISPALARRIYDALHEQDH